MQDLSKDAEKNKPKLGPCAALSSHGSLVQYPQHEANDNPMPYN